MPKKDQNNYCNATKCYMCNGSFGEDKGFVKARDHCHRTGSFKGAAHQTCNINYFSTRFLPVFFHSLSGYDQLHIIEQAYDICDQLIEVKPLRRITDDPEGDFKKGDYVLNENGEQYYYQPIRRFRVYHKLARNS